MSTGQGRKNSSKKNTSRSNSRSSNRKMTKQEAAREAFIIQEIEIIITFAIMIFLFLCNFGLIGSIGNFLSTIMFGLVGFMAYLLPVFLFFSIAFGSINAGNPVAVRKLIAASVLFMLCGIVIHFICYSFPDIYENSFSNLYLECSTNKNGGGIICGSMALLMRHFFDKVGAILLVLVLAIICFVVLTERSFVDTIKRGSQHVMERSALDSDTRREYSRMRKEELENIRLERQEEYKRREEAKKERVKERQLKQEEKETEKILRMDKKVTGVTLDTTLPRREDIEMLSKARDDIHEITLDSADPLANVTIHTERKSDAIIEPVIEPVMEPVIDPSSFEQQKLPLEVEKVSSKPVEMEAKKEHTHTPAQRVLNRPASEYKFPPIHLLKKGNSKSGGDSDQTLKATALRLQQCLHTFGVKVTITDISQGPAVTRYELQPEQGVKVSKIVGLADDIKLNLAATDIRIEAPIPGKAAIGIEVPNKENSAVALRDLFETKTFKEFPSKIAFAVGKDIGGQTIVTDIGKMPHMLIAGATGSGKSVCINTLIMSILYKAHPDDVKLIMIDPKVVELSVYNGIPHLLIPVVTDPKKAAGALQWGVSEMTDRYQKFADFNVRDLKGYNQKVESMEQDGSENVPKKLPQIVIIVDELADLMMVAPGDVEESICRLAQLARAAGIHLIIATQRPSVDVITGLIKANMPSRVAFAVSSGVDSRTILDMNGAEKLLGKGDMLFYPQGYSKPARIQGAFVSDKEVSDVVDFLKNQSIGNVYADDVEEKIKNMDSSSLSGGVSEGGNDRDEYFEQAGKFIIEKDKASIGMLQRVFKIGFNRAARIMDQLCDYGVVGEEEGTKPRKVLMSLEQFEQLLEEI